MSRTIAKYTERYKMVHKGNGKMTHHQSGVPKFFEMKFWEWQAGERRTQQEFAEYLGVEPGTLSHWMNGARIPDYDSATTLSSKLGPVIYDVCGYLRPDPQLRKVVSMWDKLGTRGKDIILRSVMEAVNQVEAEKSNYGSESSVHHQ
jgi:transcriptional regulator with XRE-family HTH domain